MTEGSEVFEGRVPTMVRLQLAELVAANGTEILADPRRVRAMLSDTASTAVREINLINLALSEGVPDRLAHAADDPLRLQTEIENLTRQLERNNALHHDAAEWAVRSCAWALGLDTPPENLEPVIPTPPIAAPVPRPQPPTEPRTTPEPGAAPSATPAPEPEPVAPEPVRPTRTGVFLAIGAALLVVAVVVGAAVVLVIGTSGGGGGGNGTAGHPSHTGRSFTAADRKLMRTLPRIAPIKACTAEPSRAALTCTVALSDSGPGRPSAEHVQYFARGTQGEAESEAFYFATHRAAPPTVWTTPSGQRGGKVQTWTESSPGSVFHHVAWTFRIGGTYYAATTSTCCDDAAGLSMMSGWRSHATTSNQLMPVSAG